MADEILFPIALTPAEVRHARRYTIKSAMERAKARQDRALASLKRTGCRFKHWDELQGFTHAETSKRDCTVRALAVAWKLSYQEAHEFLAALGRKPNRGFRFLNVENMRLNGLGFEFLPEVKRKWKTVGQFISEHQKGTYVIGVRAHVFPIVDGVYHDWSPRLKRPLRWVCRVVPK